MVIITDKNGNELDLARNIKKIDIDLADTKDFEITIPAAKWNAALYAAGNMFFMPDSEFGGIIGGKKTDTGEDVIVSKGMSWRGKLDSKIIKPPAGADYKTISGELNACVKELIEEAGLQSLFYVPSVQTEASVSNFQFDRYVTLLSGIEKMLASKEHKLKIRFARQERGSPGYVQVEAVPVEDYSDTTELSQNNRLNFTFEEKLDGVNHLICLGGGELEERTVVDLYIQQDGSVGTMPEYTGIDEIEATYEYTSADEAELTEKGSEKLLELTNSSEFKMNIGSSFDINVDVGDIVGGRDYITGMHMKKPVTNKIYTMSNSAEKIEYKIEGND